VLHVVARKVYCDMTWEEAIREEFPKNEGRAKKKMRALQKYTRSPAVKSVREKMLAQETDVRAMASEVIAAHAMKIGFLNLKVLEIAQRTDNLPELAKQSRWLAENYGMTIPKKSETSPTAIHITLNNATISGEIPMGESESHKILPAEIVTDE
jgi:hypothetical protein